MSSSSKATASSSKVKTRPEHVSSNLPANNNTKFVFQSPSLRTLLSKFKKEHEEELKNASSSPCYIRTPSICEENDFIVKTNTVKLSTQETIQVLPPDNDVSKKVFKVIDGNQPGSFFFNETHFCVSNIDTMSAAIALYKDAQSVAALSFANDTNPGGYYRAGAKAQEEDLCRTIPELYATLVVDNQKFYPIMPSEALLSNDLFVLRRSGDYALLPHIIKNAPRVKKTNTSSTSKTADENNDDEKKDSDEINKEKEASSSEKNDTDDFFASIPKISIITSAMPRGLGNHRPKGGFLNPESEWHRTVTLRIRTVLQAAKLSGKKDLVLGAFGSGAFGNPPQYVAEVFKEQLCTCPDFIGCFERVVFAIIDPMMTGNLKPFLEVFADKSE